MDNNPNFSMVQAALVELNKTVGRQEAAFGELQRSVWEVPSQIKQAIDQHLQDCPLYQGALKRGADEITGVHDVTGYRRREIPSRSSIPAAIAKVPLWLRYLLFCLGSAVAGALGIETFTP